MENKEKFISRFLDEVISTLCDRDYQKRVWADGTGTECDSFDETINSFYYFYRIIEDNFKDYGLTEKKIEQ